MHIALIERDIRNREDALRRCTSNVTCLQRSPRAAEHTEAIRLLSQEAFYLQDQLEQYHTLITFLREEQGVCDEMLPRV